SHSLAEQVLGMGFMISFAGNLSFKKADELREVARKIPLDRLLIETDCPYLAPVPMRGRRNEPSFILHTAKHLGELHDMTGEEIGRLTTENFLRFFRERGLPARIVLSTEC
ncbi:MAG: TatD family hydrolase, partial [Pyrinomonadaceae bacterium]